MKFPANDIISLLDERLEYNLAESTNKDVVLGELLDDGLLQEMKGLKLEYGTSQGNPRLRERVGQKLGVDKDEIVITNGSIFGILLSILCVCEPGDEVLTVKPNFPPTMDLIDGLGFEKKLVTLRFENQYQLDVDDVYQSVTSKTRLIILVSPLNPTGTTIEYSDVVHLSNLLQKNYPDCLLLIDETYREAAYGDNPILPTYAGIADNVVTTASLSKCHGTPGLRIGWLQSSDAAFINQAKIAKMNTVISNSVLDELIAINVLEKEQALFEARRKHAVEGFEITKRWVAKNAQCIEWIEPGAGALCCIRLNKEVFQDEDVDRFYDIAKEHSIQLADGQWFGESKRIFRLGFGYMDIDMLISTLEKLTQILQSLKNGIKTSMPEQVSG